MAPILVTVWGENFHENDERDRERMKRLYPAGMHGAIANGLIELLGDRHPGIKRVLANAVLRAAPHHSVDFTPPVVVNEPAPLTQGQLRRAQEVSA